MSSIRNFIFRLIYTSIITPFAFIIFLLIAPFNKKLYRGFYLRKKTLLKNYPKHSKPIWFHCSAGEFEYARPVIRELKQQFKDIPILVTYFSPSYVEAIEKDPNVDFCLPLPFDFPGAVSSFLNYFKPRSLLIARTDLWPELLYQCKNKTIPTILFSRTQTKANFLAKILTPWDQWIYSLLDAVLVVNIEDQKNYSYLNISTPIYCIGDTRYDQVLFRLLQTNPKIKENLKPNNSLPTFIAGSTWPKDEKVILPGIKQILVTNKINIFIAPHEPTKKHLSQLKSYLTSLNLPYQLYSTATTFKDDHIMIVDVFGILTHLYDWSDIAFVGGSFKAKVHSVMEPLAAGNFTIIGPKNINNREAQEFMKLGWELNYSPVFEVANSSEFTETVNKEIELLSDESHIKIKNLITQHAGASLELIELGKKQNWFS